MQRDYLTRTVWRNRWIPHDPTEPQAVFLTLPHREALYGGAAGGGKSDALLMGALQFADEPGYAALILRRTYADLSLPGAIMDRAHQWLGGGPAHWNEIEKTYTFPSGATLTFGYLQHKNDVYRYQGAAFQFIAFDELTQFRESEYRYLFSRLRRGVSARVPLRMRAASNPGGVGHEWVFERFFVRGSAEGRAFVPAKLTDNPYLDQGEYEQSLAELDPITRQQLLDGLWVVDQSTRPFVRDWWRGRNRFDVTDQAIVNRSVARVLSFDTGMKDKSSSAYSAATVGEFGPDYRMYIRHAWREKLIFPDLVDQIVAMVRHHDRDNKLRAVVIEDKASGTSAYQTILAAYPQLGELLVPYMPVGSKEERAAQAAVWCKLGCVLLPHPSEAVPWLYDYESELFGFPDAEYRDWVDTLSQLVSYMEHYIRAGWQARQGQGQRQAVA